MCAVPNVPLIQAICPPPNEVTRWKDKRLNMQSGTCLKWGGWGVLLERILVSIFRAAVLPEDEKWYQFLRWPVTIQQKIDINMSDPG